MMPTTLSNKDLAEMRETFLQYAGIPAHGDKFRSLCRDAADMIGLHLRDKDDPKKTAELVEATWLQAKQEIRRMRCLRRYNARMLLAFDAGDARLVSKALAGLVQKLSEAQLWELTSLMLALGELEEDALLPEYIRREMTAEGSMIHPTPEGLQ